MSPRNLNNYFFKLKKHNFIIGENVKKLCIFISILIFFTINILGSESSLIKSAKDNIYNNELEKARAILNKCIEKYPDSYKAYYWLGFIDGQESKWDNMIKHFNQCLSISDKFSKEILHLKEQYYSDLLGKGQKLFKSAFGKLGEIELLKKQGKIGVHESDIDYEIKKRKLKNKPEKSKWNINKLETEVKEAFREIAATQEAALKINPNSIEASQYLSRALLMLNEQEKLIESFKKLLTKNPNHKFALSTLAEIYYDEGIRNECHESLKKSVEYNERLLNIESGNKDVLNKIKKAKEVLEKNNQ